MHLNPGPIGMSISQAGSACCISKGMTNVHFTVGQALLGQKVLSAWTTHETRAHYIVQNIELKKCAKNSIVKMSQQKEYISDHSLQIHNPTKFEDYLIKIKRI